MIKTNKEIKRFDLENDFIVDVEKCADNEWVDFWLYHKDCGIKAFMFGLYMCAENDYEKFIENNVQEYIEAYKEDYLKEI